VKNHAIATTSQAAAYTSGYDRVFQISALVTVVAFFVSFALPRNTGRAARCPERDVARSRIPLPLEPA